MLIFVSIVLIALAILALILVLRKGGPLPYARAPLFTPREAAFYKELRRYAEKRELTLFAKIRMADLLTVTAGPKRYQGWFNKISQKHADFVLCDKPGLEVLAVVELDDSSHHRPDRQERDAFVDKAYAAAGIPILHVWEQRGRVLTDLLDRILF